MSRQADSIRSRPRARRLALLATTVLVASVTGGVLSSSLTAAPSCFGRAPTRMGNGGDNTIVGTPGRDVLIGRGGDDTIRGKGGRDYICGNAGEDVLNGGPGADRMKGASDIDFLAGNAGNDVMIGGGAGDEVHAEIGRPSDEDVARGARGSDFINTQDGRDNDTASGGPGSDSCTTDPADTVGGCP